MKKVVVGAYLYEKIDGSYNIYHELLSTKRIVKRSRFHMISKLYCTYRNHTAIPKKINEKKQANNKKEK